MADQWTVRRHGTDTSGRGIFATDYMWAWWQGVLADLDFEPTIVQGAWMVRNGGGAAASAGYHDGGGTFDLRTWDLTRGQVDQLIRVLRKHGAAAWRRDRQHGGMDPHIHLTLGTDRGLASGARWQWNEYLAGRDGLASGGRDYEWRPDPLVTTPPKEDDVSYLDWPKKDREALAEDIAKAVLRTKDVNNRDADGELQKVVSLAAQVSNIESSVDQLRNDINRFINKE